MTNLEWLRTLSAEGFRDVFFGSKCNRCAYSGPKGCPTKDNGYPDCDGGVLKWLNREHKEELKPCPCCGGEAVLANTGVYCNDCGMGTTFGVKTIEDAIKTWNRRMG